MAKVKLQGSQLAIASTFGASKAMSAVTNANPGVATLEAAHGIIVGDVFEITSGWSLLNNRVIRAAAVATNDVDLEGVSTTSTSDYPAGEGTGTIREVTAWTNITQLRPDVSVSGGGTRKTEVTEIPDRRAVQLPILIEAVALEFKAHWDPTLTWFPVLTAASDAAAQTPFRWILPGSRTIYGNAFWSFNEEPTPEGGVLVATISLDLTAKSITYTT